MIVGLRDGAAVKGLTEDLDLVPSADIRQCTTACMYSYRKSVALWPLQELAHIRYA